MNERKHQAWNFWSVFFFFGLVFLVGYFIQRKEIDIREISFREAIVIILASYRLTRILVFEKIFKFLRDAVKRREDLYLIGTFGSIITCPWCAGVWITLIIIVFYYLVPFGDLLTYVLALAGIATIIILFSNLIHMWADTKQRIHRNNKHKDFT